MEAMNEPPAKKASLLGRLRSLPLWMWVALLVIESIILVGLVVVFLVDADQVRFSPVRRGRWQP